MGIVSRQKAKPTMQMQGNRGQGDATRAKRDETTRLRMESHGLVPLLGLGHRHGRFLEVSELDVGFST